MAMGVPPRSTGGFGGAVQSAKTGVAILSQPTGQDLHAPLPSVEAPDLHVCPPLHVKVNPSGWEWQPFPSCPFSPSPQHFMAPDSRTAHAWW